MAESAETHIDGDSSAANGSEAAKYPGKGFRIGEYLIVDTLGHGSMATVFLAKDATGHEVALKLFQEGPGISPTLLERFKREAEASKKLRRHPNIMKVYATGKEGPYHYIVMEPIRHSRTVEDCIDTGALPMEGIIGIIVKIARALHYAHSRHIVHRDIKPTNIMIDEFGEPLLTDFGVAALIDWPSFTMSGALTGTPLYMSPEQARAERVGPASDIYSLGVVLYEAVLRVLPYSTQHSAPVKSVLEAVKHELPKRPRAIRKDLSPDLEAVMLKALEKEPSRRYADAEAMACDLERMLAGRRVHARLFSRWERLISVGRRHRRILGAAALLLVVAGAAALYFRMKLMSERYEKLMSMVQLRNVATRLVAQRGPAAETTSQTPGAGHALRTGRRAMNNEDWTTAVAELQGAANLSEAAGDARSVAIAQLDQARSEYMLNNTARAHALYAGIMKNPDASSIIADFAQMESVIMALLQGDQAQAVESLGRRPLPSGGPMREMMDCLTGATDTQRLLRSAESMPQRLQNDAHLVAAVRFRVDKNAAAFRSELQRCLKLSSPPSEWPAPMARRLRSLPN
jgi:hypothetical protein